MNAILPGSESFRTLAIYDYLTPTIFHEPWWLETVAPGHWKSVECVVGGVVVGRMPYSCSVSLWFQKSRMPPLTHFLGPAISPGKGSRASQLLRRISITRELIQKLPRIETFSQKLHRGVDNVVAFQMERFESSVQFTFEIEPQPWEIIWSRMRDKTRNAIRNGEKAYTLGSMEAEEFIRLYRKNLAARRWEEFIDMDVQMKLIIACRSRGRGDIVVARDVNGEAKAAIFCVWDRVAYYYLISTRTLDSGNGAISFLLCSAIKDAIAKNLIFDFDGLGYLGAVGFYAGFGAAVAPRYIVSKSGAAFRLLREARRILGYPDNPFT
jgi:Acetyltransferase (GNAT) domain